MTKARRIKQLRMDNAQLRARLRQVDEVLIHNQIPFTGNYRQELKDLVEFSMWQGRTYPAQTLSTRRQAAEATTPTRTPIWAKLYIAAILWLGIAVLSDRALNHPSWLDFARSHLYILLPASLVSRTEIR